MIGMLSKIILARGFSNSRAISNSKIQTLPAKKIFLTGTDTNIGKTIVSSWLCLHSRFDYWKPISSGASEDSVTSDSVKVKTLARVKVHPEVYTLREPLSPHLAAQRDNVTIDLDKISLPSGQQLIVEGAGGVLVPLNEHALIIDLIKKLDLPVLLMASSKLGTINHTLLSLEALRSRVISVLGVIVKGTPNQDNCDAIERYGKVQVLAQVPHFENVTAQALQNFPLTSSLKKILN